MKFPKTLYVKAKDDGKQHYFISDQDIETHVVIGEKIKVGIYELKEVVNLEAKIQWQRTTG